MRKRKLLAVGGVLALVAAGAFVAWPPAYRITIKNLERVQEGMSRADVEAILGPPGDYRTVPGRELFAIDRAIQSSRVKAREDEFSLGLAFLVWSGDAHTIRIAFGPEGVLDSYIEPVLRQEQSPLDNFLWRAKRQWRRWFPE
jgi:hypothetical protein